VNKGLLPSPVIKLVDCSKAGDLYLSDYSSPVLALTFELIKLKTTLFCCWIYSMGEIGLSSPLGTAREF
jgi:hypothetical protein